MVQKMSVVTAIVTFLLILAGGWVHSTGSSLACPDWPLCYGTFFPEMKGKVLYEHGHRLMAGTVIILTLITTVLVWKQGPENLRPFMAIGMTGLIIQSLLGGITVIYKLPTVISTAHLAVGSAFLSIMVWVSLAVCKNPGHRTQIPASIRNFAGFTLVATYIQIVLGGLVRHTHSGMVCDAFPACTNGVWFPGSSGQVYLHMAHRFWGMVVFFMVLFLIFKSKKHADPQRYLVLKSVQAFGLVCIQIFLGIASVLSGLSLFTIMSHLAVGEALLVVLVVIYFRCSDQNVIKG